MWYHLIVLKYKNDFIVMLQEYFRNGFIDKVIVTNPIVMMLMIRLRLIKSEMKMISMACESTNNAFCVFVLFVVSVCSNKWKVQKCNP